jgi:hypothetical protein
MRIMVRFLSALIDSQSEAVENELLPIIAAPQAETSSVAASIFLRTDSSSFSSSGLTFDGSSAQTPAPEQEEQCRNSVESLFDTVFRCKYMIYMTLHR